ncbi:MAG: hypothetical protein EB084_14855 [Proteobacteria bacterium]|nr:hypothetical protein [Pseudomonadota bacterium]
MFLMGLPLAALLLLATPSIAAEPGSKDDPIVTRSYLETLYSWQVTSLQEGQTVSLDLGVQFVVRSGSAVVVGVGAEGLLDLTAGKELRDGERIPPCHLVLSPASDHRGVRAMSQVVLLTRGFTR